ncbi:MAG TPA: CusA/CzcA family heavy metal efflux RND transporter, partial [Candidatus Binataceae bacterium]
LVKYGLKLEDVFRALESNNSSAGGGYIVRNGEQQLIRGDGLVGSLEDLGNIVVGSREGVPIYVKSLGNVAFAPRIRQGAVTHDGKGETVVGIAMLLIGENSRVVVDRVKKQITNIEKTLPEGVQIVPYYDRADLINRTIGTVARLLIEGAVLVTVLLFLFLGDLRTSLIVASVIPLAMLVAFTGMRWAGVSGNLMSLGAIDFGLIVDGSIVMSENIFRRLSHDDVHGGSSMVNRVFNAGREVLRPIVFAISIIIIVYLPILTFEEVEGKMFRPMALTVVLALAASLLCALTYVPVMITLFIKKVSHTDTWLARRCDLVHARLMAVLWVRPRTVVLVAAAIILTSFAYAPFLGSEFIPNLDEGTINLDVLRVPSIALGGAIQDATRAEKALLEVPEVTRVVSRIGRPEIATDTTGPDESDVYVFLRPRAEWRFKDREGLVAELSRKLNERVPETRFGFSQPIESRINDLIAGIKADLAIHIYGDDLDKMLDMGQLISKTVAGVPGAADVRMMPRTGLPQLEIQVDRQAVARYGINASDVLDAVEAVGGRVVGTIIDGPARYLMQVRFAKASRASLDALQDIKVAAPNGTLIPLSQLAKFDQKEGPVAIWRQNLNRRVTVAANVRGTDLGSFVSSVKQAIGKKVELPRGWRLEWGGQYENLNRASRRLTLLVPVSMLLIIVLLYNTFTSMRLALMIFSSVLAGASGAILALALRGLTFSITAGVGFITLFGMAVLDGVILISGIVRERELGRSVTDATYNASRDRLRASLLAALVALFGFLPMALSHGAGSEVQKPLATVVIGGLLLATPFTRYVVPILYRWIVRDEERLNPPVFVPREGQTEMQRAV